MASLTKLVFVNENEQGTENLFEVFSVEGIEVPFDVKKHLKFISAKTNNNYIGYYQFVENDIYYKIYILPKTTPKVESEEENKRNFISLLSKYYELKNEYNSIKPISKNRNIVDFAFESEKESNRSDELDKFIDYKYKDALQTIEQFFKRHKNSLSKEKKFYAQSIRHQFDLKRNILELDKSKIHQQKKEPYLYSKLAIISVEVLQHFLKHKGKNREAKKLKNRIEAKYGVDSYHFKPKEIGSKKVLKLFKSSDDKELYLALLSLLGVENYFEDNNYKEILKLHNQHAHFFRPEDLYEWMVYDKLIQEYGKDAVKMKSTYYYNIANESRKAEPDFVVTYGDEIIVIDAKWKILDKEIKISFDDVAKLWRDRLLTEATKAVLLYPQIDFLEKHHSMMIKDEEFDFETRVIEL